MPFTPYWETGSKLTGNTPFRDKTTCGGKKKSGGNSTSSQERMLKTALANIKLAPSILVAHHRKQLSAGHKTLVIHNTKQLALLDQVKEALPAEKPTHIHTPTFCELTTSKCASSQRREQRQPLARGNTKQYCK